MPRSSLHAIGQNGPLMPLAMLAGALWLVTAVDASVQAEAELERDEDPAEVVNSLHAALLEAARLQADADFEDRYERLAPTVEAAFDLDLLAQLVLAPRWASLDESQQEAFTDVLRRFTIATYADRFAQDVGQRFSLRSVNEQRPNLHVVRTTLTVDRETEHRFDYQLRRAHGRWRIVNVAVNGVSDLALRREQYVDVIDREGFETLIDKLEARIETMAQGNDDDEA